MSRRILGLLALGLIVLGVTFAASAQNSTAPPEIHCKHFFHGYPTGTAASNDLIIRDIYALSSNDDTKMADWVAYRLDEETVFGDAETKRNYRSDPWLADEETLEKADYKDAHAEIGVDKGHQAPLASFKGTDCWADTNYFSNLTPQNSRLNQGLWRRLEEKVRDLVEEGNTVFVMTGPLYERDMDPLPQADEPHRVPSGYWKIMIIEPQRSSDPILAASFIFDQETPTGYAVIDQLCTIDEVEQRSGLDFLREMPDGDENQIESNDFKEWAEDKFG